MCVLGVILKIKYHGLLNYFIFEINILCIILFSLKKEVKGALGIHLETKGASG